MLGTTDVTDLLVHESDVCVVVVAVSVVELRVSGTNTFGDVLAWVDMAVTIDGLLGGRGFDVVGVPDGLVVG